MTGIKLDLITDRDVLDMVEKEKRGGLVFCGDRYSKANNHYLPDYNSNEDENYIMYWDANNLYGWAMVQPLPYKDLKFNDNISLRQILNTPDNADTGYIVEVDFEFPRHLHDKFKQFVPCPETIAPKAEWFSELQLELAEKNGIIRNEVYQGGAKLIPHLFKHERYVIHYRNLKYIHQLGVKITALHRTISFKQKTWLAKYIEFNNDKRKEATNEFERDLFKLMHKAIFGKSSENPKNRIELQLTTSNEKAIKWFSKLHFKSSTCIVGLHLIQMFKQELIYDRPSYIGCSILDLSKVHMMKFVYEVIHSNFEGRYTILYSDTDSLVIDIKHPDIYEWIKENKQHFDLAESSRADMKDHTNEKKLGAMKDETKGLIIKEFVSVSPKCYSYNVHTVDKHKQNCKKMKGINKVVIKKEIKHEDFVNILNSNQIIKKDNVNFRSFNHQVYTITIEDRLNQLL